MRKIIFIIVIFISINYKVYKIKNIFIYFLKTMVVQILSQILGVEIMIIVIPIIFIIICYIEDLYSAINWVSTLNY